ncbi:pentatricopeptide repeat-containing protein At3g29230-like [Wolffia australiana]
MTALPRAPRWTSQRRLLEQTLAELAHNSTDLHAIKQAHAQVFKLHLHGDLFAAPKLITAYAGRHRLFAAVAVFHLVPQPNTHLYNTLLRAYAAFSFPIRAFSSFISMQRAAIKPDNFTFPFLLKSCAETMILNVEMIHAQVAKSGFFSDIFVPNSLLDAYHRCAVRSSAGKLFDEMPWRDLVSWNTMIAGLAKGGEMAAAEKLFEEMPDRDLISWNAMLAGYARAGDGDRAFEVFEMMPERNVVSWSTVVSGYCKKDDLDMARKLFEEMKERNLVVWTIIVSAYAGRGRGREAMALFERMEEEGMEVDGAAAVSILAACAESGLKGLGMMVEAQVRRMKTGLTTQVYNALLDMYAKCGDLGRAQELFQTMPRKDLVSWNSMLHALALHGRAEEALSLFRKMSLQKKKNNDHNDVADDDGNYNDDEGVVPDGVTFLGVLSACAHGGLVEEGRMIFAAMERDYSVRPSIEHFGAMVDLLGRNGLLEEALWFIKAMPIKPNAVIWGTLLVACRGQGEVGLAEEVLGELERLPEMDAGNLAAASGVYAAAKRWDLVSEVRTKMRDAGAEKMTGLSCIEIDGVVSEFSIGDRSHHQSEQIVKMLQGVGDHIRHLSQTAAEP